MIKVVHIESLQFSRLGRDLLRGPHTGGVTQSGLAGWWEEDCAPLLGYYKQLLLPAENVTRATRASHAPAYIYDTRA